MLEHFGSLCRFIDGQISCDEDWSAWLEGENTDYCRINGSLLRQSGQVDKTLIKLILHKGMKRATGTLTLSMVPEDDRHRLGQMIRRLRVNLLATPDDPFYRWNEKPVCTRTVTEPKENKAGFCGRTAVRDILEAANGIDLVGILMIGWVFRAFGSSRGHHQWFENYSYCLDYSVYHHGDKAVHDQVSGHQWDKELFQRRLESVKQRVSLLGQSVKEVPRGDYRVYLSPAAINAMLFRLDFSARKFHEKDSWLHPLFEGEKQLNTKVTLDLVTGDGSVPSFQQQGYMRPETLSLIKGGAGDSLITGPRTAEKYKIPFNGGEDRSFLDTIDPPDHLVMTSGTLEEDDICARIGNGLYISDLWYVNWSDKNSGRMTGMTRYACFEVKNGKLAQPIGVMRFDDSLYNLFGHNLEDLTRQRDTIMDSFAFYRRDTASHVLPGALIGNMHFSF